MESCVKSKIRTLYPDADFSTIRNKDLIVFGQLIQDGLTKSHYNDSIRNVKVKKLGFIFDKTKEPCLEFKIIFLDHNKQEVNNLDLICYAFDVEINYNKDEVLQEIFLNAWHKLMISKFKENYCDGLSNYILAFRVRNGEEVAEITSKKLREVIEAKYSIEKEETNQP